MRKYIVFYGVWLVKGLFGLKELGGSEEVGSVFFYFRCSSKHWKRKMKKSSFPSLFSFTQSFSHFQSATVDFVVM